MNYLLTIVKDETGATAIEYGLILPASPLHHRGRAGRRLS